MCSIMFNKVITLIHKHIFKFSNYFQKFLFRIIRWKFMIHKISKCTCKYLNKTILNFIIWICISDISHIIEKEKIIKWMIFLFKEILFQIKKIFINRILKSKFTNFTFKSSHNIITSSRIKELFICNSKFFLGSKFLKSIKYKIKAIHRFCCFD